MPLPNTRVVILGVPRADQAFEVVEVNKKDVQRQAEQFVKDEQRKLDEIKRNIAAAQRAQRGR